MYGQHASKFDISYLQRVKRLIRQTVFVQSAWKVSAFLLFILAAGHCKKEYSYEGGTAVFQMLKDGGSCFDPVLSGNYNPGVPLGSSNTVQLRVHVEKTGRFSLQTDTRAGIIFSTSGSITDTGVQVITLHGSGIPDSSGDFLFTTQTSEPCSFTVHIAPPQSTQAAYTLQGSPGGCTNVQVLGDYYAGQTLVAGNHIVINVDVTSPGDYYIQTDLQNGFGFLASGHFSQTGVQTVTLAGDGTPETARNLLFTTTGGGSSCSFPLSVVTTGVPATYVLESGGGYCVAQIEGAYTAGTPLTSSNTVAIRIFVRDPGVFTIATATVNGVYFSASGEFTSTGVQFVTLYGVGTPTIVGTYTLRPEIVGPTPIGGAACDFDLDVK